MYELLWIDIFVSWVRWLTNNRQNHWQIASQVTQKSLFTVTNVLFNFLHAILCPEHTYDSANKQLWIADFAIVA